jgi:hypothetical protein
MFRIHATILAVAAVAEYIQLRMLLYLGILFVDTERLMYANSLTEEPFEGAKLRF